MSNVQLKKVNGIWVGDTSFSTLYVNEKMIHLCEEMGIDIVNPEKLESYFFLEYLSNGLQVMDNCNNALTYRSTANYFGKFYGVASLDEWSNNRVYFNRHVSLKSNMINAISFAHALSALLYENAYNKAQVVIHYQDVTSGVLDMDAEALPEQDVSVTFFESDNELSYNADSIVDFDSSEAVCVFAIHKL